MIVEVLLFFRERSDDKLKKEIKKMKFEIKDLLPAKKISHFSFL